MSACRTMPDMSVRVEFRWPDELAERVDEARGDVSRARFVRRAVERALGDRMQSEQSEKAGSTPALPASAQPPLSRADVFRRMNQKGKR